MKKMKYTLLAELNGRLEADLLKSYLEANKIDVELFQESVGQHAYPVTVDGLGRVEVFVPTDKLREARKLLKTFTSEESGKKG